MKAYVNQSAHIYSLIPYLSAFRSKATFLGKRFINFLVNRWGEM